MEPLKDSFEAEEPDVITWVCSPVFVSKALAAQ